jgi:cytochrome c oxidase subunit 3
MGLVAILATVTMLFTAFTAALLVRRTGTDWTPIALPPIVWVNTVFLVASSAAVELARVSLRRDTPDLPARWLGIAGLLGVLFLVGQIAAWRALSARGVFLPTSPHASFFYMLTAVHGAHVLGGLGALGWTLSRTLGGAYTREHHAGFTHTAIYWHFVGGVWIYLLILLSTF